MGAARSSWPRPAPTSSAGSPRPIRPPMVPSRSPVTGRDLHRGPDRAAFGPRLWLVLALGVLSLILSACRVDVTTRVDVEADGSGLVTVRVVLDSEVMEWVDVDSIRLSDLAESGWEVDDPLVGEDGSVSISARRTFASPDDLQVVLEGIDGPGGLIGSARLSVDPGLGRTDYSLRIEVEPRASILDYTDADLTKLLDGEPFGVPLAELESRAGGPLEDTVSFVVEAGLPGGVEARVPGDGELHLGDDPTVLELSSVVEDPEALAAAARADELRSDVPRAFRTVGFAWAGALVLLVGAFLATRTRP